MKWENKGNEFHRFAYLTKVKKLYIYGAGIRGKKVYDQVIKYCGTEIAIIFVDEKVNSDEIYEVIRPEVFFNKEQDTESIVVIAIEDAVDNLKISNLLLLYGYTENLNFFNYHSFLQIYLKMLALFSFGRCSIDVISIPLNFKCTLKCKNCSGRFPELTRKKVCDRDMKDVLKDAQCLFDKIDFVKQFDGGGGEVFLYPDLADFLNEITKNYGDKIGEHLIVTNGTVMPDDKLCRAIKDNGIKLYVSYYDNINGWKERYSEIEKKLKYYDIYPYEVHHKYWSDFQFKNEAKDLNDAELCRHYEKCMMRCSVFMDGVEYNCYSGVSNSMLLNCLDENDGLRFETADKTEIFEFNYGFHKNGAPSYCAYCGGVTMDSEIVCPAEQVN